jgi:uncharacterized membrane protein YedE/YeeE
MKNSIYVILGILFGIVLTKSEVISWFRIHKMFLFIEPDMYLLIGSAIIVGAFSVFLLKRLSIKSIDHQALTFSTKTFNRGFIYGSLIFGAGWAISGACPGPIYAQIGTGAYPAIFTLAGATAGAMLYYLFKSRLPH